MSCVLRRLSGRGGGYNDDVCLEAQAFGGEGGKPHGLASPRGEVVDRDGVPIQITQIAQTLEERVKSARLRRTWIERKESEPRGPPRHLRLGEERRGEEGASDHAKEGSSLYHSMT